jgi:hypothetical protein
MFTGWSIAARNVYDNKDGAVATLMERRYLAPRPWTPSISSGAGVQ